MCIFKCSESACISTLELRYIEFYRYEECRKVEKDDIRKTGNH